MLYHLKFVDVRERAIFGFDIEAADDKSALHLGCAHCVGVNMPVELSEGDRHIIRVTPMTARLYLGSAPVPAAWGQCATGLRLSAAVAIGGPDLVVTWDPGIAVPAGEAFILHNPSSYSVDAYLDGYTVPSAAAPAVGGQTIEWHGKLHSTR
jgi:hypothetical protein